MPRLDSPTRERSIYNLFSVQLMTYNCSSLKVTINCVSSRHVKHVGLLLQCHISDSVMASKLGMAVLPGRMHGSNHARFNDLDSRSYIVGRQRQEFSVELFRQLSKERICYHGRPAISYVTLTLQTFIYGLTSLFFAS